MLDKKRLQKGYVTTAINPMIGIISVTSKNLKAGGC